MADECGPVSDLPVLWGPNGSCCVVVCVYFALTPAHVASLAGVAEKRQCVSGNLAVKQQFHLLHAPAVTFERHPSEKEWRWRWYEEALLEVAQAFTSSQNLAD